MSIDNVDFWEEINLDQPVYWFLWSDLHSPLKTCTLRDLCWDAAEETPTPHGVSKVMHVHEKEVRQWYPNGQWRIVYAFDTESEAEHACMMCHLYDLRVHDDIYFCSTATVAEQTQKEYQQEIE